MALSATAKSRLPRLRARPAGTPSASAVIGIRVIEGVAVNAVRLTSFSSGWRFATKNILALCHWLQMVRIDAMADPAKVVELHPVGDRSNAELVRPAMREGRSPIQPHVSVAIRTHGAAPQPAAIRELDIAPDADSVVPSNLTYGVGTALFLPSLPMHGTPAARKAWAVTVFNRAWFRGNLIGHFGTSIPGVMRQAVPAALPLFIVPKEVSDGSL